MDNPRISLQAIVVIKKRVHLQFSSRCQEGMLVVIENQILKVLRRI